MKIKQLISDQRGGVAPQDIGGLVLWIILMLLTAFGLAAGAVWAVGYITYRVKEVLSAIT